MEIDYKLLTNHDIADILLITATQTETIAVHDKMEALCDEGILTIKADNNAYYLGSFGGYNAIHCQCGDMGTQDVYASTLTTQRALALWPNVKCVIMVGIAFGMYDDAPINPQHYSDILVAEKIVPYEGQRLEPNGDRTYRANHHYSNDTLCNAFTRFKKKWGRKNIFGEETAIIVAPILCGEKLVDNIDKRNELREAFIECKGGEMEGVGVASACESIHKPWILVKGICDFADGNKGEQKKEKQKDAADSAVEACIQILLESDLTGLIPNKINYYHRSENQNLDLIFFIDYKKDKEPFYLVREVDGQIAPFIAKQNCWIFGFPGMGKSNLLKRALIFRDIPYIYVDCSIAEKTKAKSVFLSIIDNICDINEIELNIDDNANFGSIIKKLGKLLDKYYYQKPTYILIDEIPFEFDSDVFNSFADMFCNTVGYLKRNLKQAEIYFMLSSIASPMKAFDNLPELQKHKQYIKFVELITWSEDECRKLIEMLTRPLNLNWEGVTIDEFAKLHDYSPREIKNTLKEIYVMGHRTINRETVLKTQMIR